MASFRRSAQSPNSSGDDDPEQILTDHSPLVSIHEPGTRSEEEIVWQPVRSNLELPVTLIRESEQIPTTVEISVTIGATSLICTNSNRRLLASEVMKRYYQSMSQNEMPSVQSENLSEPSVHNRQQNRDESNVDELPIDPAKRKNIYDLNPNDREKIRRFYL
ncbi:hypothetical protein AgCh_040152 [Apium graveolens]